MIDEHKDYWMKTRIEAFLRYCEQQRERYDRFARVHYGDVDRAEPEEQGEIPFPEGEPIELDLEEELQRDVYDFLAEQERFVTPMEVVNHLVDIYGDSAETVNKLKRHLQWWWRRGHLIRGNQVLDEDVSRLVYKIALKRKGFDDVD